jgi:hypothetical protein
VSDEVLYFSPESVCKVSLHSVDETSHYWAVSSCISL